MNEAYRTITLDCECEHIEHLVRLQFWPDQVPYGMVYVTSPAKINNVWRRFKEAFKLIVWGEIDSGLDVLWGIDAMRDLNMFVGHSLSEMIVEQMKHHKEMDDGQQQSGGEQ